MHVSPKVFFGSVLSTLTLAILLIGSFGVFVRAEAARDLRVPTHQTQQYEYYNFFSATTTSATSTNTTDGGYLSTTGAKKVTFFFSRGGATGPNTATSTFNVQVTPDGQTWYNYNKLISNASNTNSQTLTRVATVAIEAATSTVVAGLDLEHEAFYGVRCIVVETTDGDHTCKATAEF